MKRAVKVVLALFLVVLLVIVAVALTASPSHFLRIRVVDDVCWTGGYVVDRRPSVVVGGCGPEDIRFSGCELVIGWSFGTDNGEPLTVEVHHPGGVYTDDTGAGRWSCR